MVQVLVDLRHLARVSLIGLRRDQDGTSVSATFEVAGRFTAHSQRWDARVAMPPNVSRKHAIQECWLAVLNHSLEEIRAYVTESVKLPRIGEELNTDSLGADDALASKVDASMITGYIDGSHITPNSITSQQVRSIDASKLVGQLPVDCFREAGLTFDMISGQLNESHIGSGSLHADQISSVDATRVYGVLSNATLPPKSVTSDNIASVRWDQISGAPPTHVYDALDLAQMRGTLHVHQLPERVPWDCIDVAQGLSASLLTKGHIAASVIPPRCLSGRHFTEIDASLIVGQIDGGLIAPGTLPPAALQRVDAASIEGTLDGVQSIQCTHLTSEALAAKDMVCGSLSVDQTLSVGFSASVSGKVTAGEVESQVLTCDALTTWDLSAETVHADSFWAQHVSCANWSGTSLSAENVAADAFVCSNLSSQQVSCEVFKCDTLACGSHLAVPEICTQDWKCDRLHTDQITSETHVTQELTVSDSLEAHHVRITDDLEISGSLAVRDLACDHTLTCNSLHATTVHANTQVVEDLACDHLVTKVLNVDTSADIEGKLTVVDLDVLAELRATQLVTSSVESTGECKFDTVQAHGDVYVTGCVSTASEVKAQEISAASATAQQVLCDSVDCGQAQVASVSADSVACDSATVQHLACDELRAQSLTVSTVHSDSLTINQHLHAKIIVAQDALQVNGELSCSNLSLTGDALCQTATVSDWVMAKEVDADDMVVGGRNMVSVLDALERRINEFENAYRTGRALLFGRTVYYADTVYASGHDKIEAESPALPHATISTEFIGQTYGLLVDRGSGEVHGTATYPGSFPVTTRLQTAVGAERHMLEREVTFVVYEPPVWTPPSNSLEALTRRPFSFPLVAAITTGYEAIEPFVDGVSVLSADAALVGTVSVAGVYSVGVKALHVLAHNDHILTTDALFEFTVRPVPPTLHMQEEDALQFSRASVPVEMTGLLSEDDAINLFLKIAERPPVPLSLEWMVSSDPIVLHTGTVLTQVHAIGAERYDIVARGNFPLKLEIRSEPLDNAPSVTACTIFGQVSQSKIVQFTLRAYGGGGASRDSGGGGHLDQLLTLKFVTPAADMSALNAFPTSLVAGGGAISVFAEDGEAPRVSWVQV